MTIESFNISERFKKEMVYKYKYYNSTCWLLGIKNIFLINDYLLLCVVNLKRENYMVFF